MSENQQGKGSGLSPEIHGRILSPKEMLAVGMAATALATGAANYFDGEEGRARIPAIDVEWTDSGFGSSAEELKNGFAITDGSGSEITVQDGRTIEEQQELSSTMEEEWARDFAQDEQAGRLINPQEIDNFADQLQDELEEGWSIDSISIRGTTSAEDDSVDSNGNRTAGLQETSQSAEQKQEELGDTRRELGALQLAVALQERGVAVDSSVVDRLPSIEDVLTDDEVEQIEPFVGQFGYDNITDMIERWNRDPDSAPPALDQALTELLAKERTFQVEVGMSRQVQEGAETTIPTETPGDSDDLEGFVPIEDGESEDHKFRLLPIVIPGYFFLTLGRRKAQSGRTPSTSTTPVGTGPLPPVAPITGETPPEVTPPPKRGGGNNGQRRHVPIKPPHYQGKLRRDQDPYRSDLKGRKIHQRNVFKAGGGQGRTTYAFGVGQGRK